MSSDSPPRGFVFWFLELIALGCVLVAIEGRFAVGHTASGIRWLVAALLIGLVGFRWSDAVDGMRQYFGRTAISLELGGLPDEPPDRQIAIKRLVELIHFATDTLLHAEIGPKWSLVTLRERIAIWETDVLAVLREAGCSETDKSYFDHLVTFTPSGLGGVNPDHAHIREMLAEKIHRLREITGRLEGTPIPSRSMPAAPFVIMHSQDEQKGVEVTPRIRLKEPDAAHVAKDIKFYDIATGQIFSTVDSLRLRLINDPKVPEPEATAKAIAAKISYSKDGVALKEIDGRWVDSANPMPLIAQGKSTTELLRKYFEIGAEQCLDIAIKGVADDSCYIFNTDSYLYAPTWKHPDFELGPGTYGVRVRVRGVRVDEVFKFSFVNPGSGQRLYVVAGSCKRIIVEH